MKLRVLAAVLAALPPSQVAVAQDAEQGALRQVYVLWGMMDGAANFCWEATDYDVAYMEAHQNWLANNLIVRDELAALAAAGAAPTLATEAETAGSSGILDILRQASNPEEACGNWLNATVAGQYDAEVYMAEQLGLLRERDGM